jgi:hypothetical protein
MAGRYVKKAAASIDLTAWRQGHKEAGAGNPSKQLEKKLSKRHKGIETAVKKLTNEEVENLDELSKKTLGSYVKKASHDVATRAAATSRYGEREEVARKSGDYDSARKNSKIADKAFNKGWKRRANMAKAVDKLTKEEVESIDELSKATMGSYVNKAAERIGTQGITTGLKIANDENSKKNFKNMGKRQKGIATAVKKLTKEDIDVARSMHESYKMKFDAALEYYNIKSPSELGEDKRKEFFNHVDQEFKKGDK